MIYSSLAGRIGNCLFEIAAGASLAKKMDVPYKALTCNYLEGDGGGCSLSDYLKSFQNSILRKINLSDNYPLNVPEYNEPDFLYNPLPLQEHLILKGHFQSEKYFDKELVRYLFEIDKETEAYIHTKYGHILRLNPVAIHVRRGDYLKFEYMHPVCRMSYFRKAIACFEPGTTFLVISNDIPWCKKNFQGDSFYFAEGESAIVDLYLQSKCAHNIISNSSFSWWGAWLNPNPEKKVIYPDPWFGFVVKIKKVFDTSDLCPDDWIPIPLPKMPYYFYGVLSFLRMKIRSYKYLA